MVGVVKVEPVPNEGPPDAAEYQFKIPALEEAPRTRVPASHLDAGAVEVITGVVFTVAVTVARIDGHPLSKASA